MLITLIERYVSLRQALGYKLGCVSRRLRLFAQFADARGETHVRAATALEWASQAKSSHASHIRFQNVSHFARFIHAEDPSHDVLPRSPFHEIKRRPVPYIYTSGEIQQLMQAADQLKKTYSIRRLVYRTLIGLLASTGLRISEALHLRMRDVSEDGVLQIRNTKFGKSRIVPLHSTCTAALLTYLTVRGDVAVEDDHVFISAHGRRLNPATVHATFHRLQKLSGVAPGRLRRPRIHDLRHTFATRSLEDCAANREPVARQFVALSTYLGHVDISSTYWYLEATPQMMVHIALLAEQMLSGKAP